MIRTTAVLLRAGWLPAAAALALMGHIAARAESSPPASTKRAPESELGAMKVAAAELPKNDQTTAPASPDKAKPAAPAARRASRSEACRCGSEACTADSARFMQPQLRRALRSPARPRRRHPGDTASDASLTNAGRCCGSAACCHAARRAERARSHGCTAGGRARRDARFAAACRRRSRDATRSDRRRDPPAVAGCGQGRQRR